MIKIKIINIYAKTTEKILKHKLKDGLQAKGRYCYWTRKSQFWEVANAVCPWLSRKFRNELDTDKTREALSIYDYVGYPEAWIWRVNVLNQEEANTLLHDIDIEVRLHMAVGGKKRGYFRCFGANKDFTELWFHSEDWLEVSDVCHQKAG